MKKAAVLLSIVFMICVGINVSAQIPPPGASDKSLEDRNIKNRSNELERIKRETNKPDRKNQQQPEDIWAAKFEEIKQDFEQIQLAQDEIIAAYTKGSKIDYAKISTNAQQINKSAPRLKKNLFPSAEEKKSDKKSNNETKDSEPQQDMKTLIVELDNTLASFVSNPLFTNPRVVKPADNEKGQSDLEKIIKLSTALKQTADEQSKKEN